MKARYRITCLLGAGAVLALGFAAGLISGPPPTREDSASERVAAGASAAPEIRLALDAALSDCNDACRQSRGVAAVAALGYRPPQ